MTWAFPAAVREPCLNCGAQPQNGWSFISTRMAAKAADAICLHGTGGTGGMVYRTEENLHGTYYDYDVTSGGETRRTADPYAKACGTNGRRSMAVELERTDPEGWKADRAPSGSREDISMSFM